MRILRALAVLIVLAAVGGTVLTAEDSCEKILKVNEAPQEMKTRGRFKVSHWEQVDKLLNTVAAESEGKSCQFTFGELFEAGESAVVYFPITYTVLKLAGDESLQGLDVWTRDGEPLGVYSNRVLYERSGSLYAQNSYKMLYFQYEDKAGVLQSAGKGNQMLLDSFVVSWNELKDRVAIRAESIPKEKEPAGSWN